MGLDDSLYVETVVQLSHKTWQHNQCKSEVWLRIPAKNDYVEKNVGIDCAASTSEKIYNNGEERI